MDFRSREGSFDEADRRYGELTRKRNAGTITEEEFREQLTRIMARDSDGNWWARIGDSGEWHRREGGDWVRGTPPGYEVSPAQERESPPSQDKSAGKKRRRLPRWIPVVGLIGVAVIAIVLLGWSFFPYIQNQDIIPKNLLGGGDQQADQNGSGNQQNQQGDQGGQSQNGQAQGGAIFAEVFVHQATSDNVSANSTYLDNPLTNGNPDAVLIVTQNWNPGGGSGRYNNHPTGVWYDTGRDQWAIFNQDREPMPDDAAFNVAIREN